MQDEVDIDLDSEELVTSLVEYPLPTDDLGKGSVVSVELIERCFNVKRTDQHFRLKMLQAKSYVVRKLASRDLHVVVRTLSTGLHILTDEEALVFLPQFFENRVRSTERVFQQLKLVDRGKLSPNSQALYDRACTELGYRVQAQRRARKEAPKLAPVQRQTPGLLAKQS